MNFNSILGWAIAALAMAGLIVFIRLRNKNRAKKNQEPLLLFAKENGSEISHLDSWDNTLIGIDNKENNSLFFIRNVPGNTIREKITLMEVSGCRMFITERKVKYPKETVNVIDRIELIFSFDNHRPELNLEFYNSDYDQLTLSGELQLAQKWTGILKTIINVNQEWKAKGQSNSYIEKRKPVNKEYAL